MQALNSLDFWASFNNILKGIYGFLCIIQISFKKILELKSLKLYINSYRNEKISHEEVANRILNDFVVASNPSWMQIEADFNPRGNVHTIVRVTHGSR